LRHAVERLASIKERFVAFEVSPDGSNASITVSSKASDKPGSARREAPMQDTTWIPWIPVVVPLLALLPTLAAYVIGWGALAGTH
jgi:hypothetical protein